MKAHGRRKRKIDYTKMKNKWRNREMKMEREITLFNCVLVCR
jgi:hypothetical protein